MLNVTVGGKLVKRNKHGVICSIRTVVTVIDNVITDNRGHKWDARFGTAIGNGRFHAGSQVVEYREGDEQLVNAFDLNKEAKERARTVGIWAADCFNGWSRLTPQQRDAILQAFNIVQNTPAPVRTSPADAVTRGANRGPMGQVVNAGVRAPAGDPVHVDDVETDDDEE